MKETAPTIKPNRFVFAPSENHSERIGHFIPRRTRDPAEAQRRRTQPSGKLILEEQAKGIEIIRKGIEGADNFTELIEWAGLAVPATLGAGQYLMNGDVMHRYIDLPMLGRTAPLPRPNVDEIRELTIGEFEKAQTLADTLVASRSFASRTKFRQIALKTGKSMTKAALLLNALPLSEETHDRTKFTSESLVQELVRDGALRAARQITTLALETGVLPSVAQLPDPLSPLAVEVQRAGTDAMDRLYSEAV